MARVVTLCGGVGAARLMLGLVRHLAADQLTALINTGDDMVLHGLHISPDIDTVIYTLAGEVSPERGWGLVQETWQAMDMVGRYGGQDWFRLGDRDLGTHLFRSQRLAEGASLAEVTSEQATAWGIGASIVPATNDRLRTVLTTSEHQALSFQDYFVRFQHNIKVTGVAFDGAQSAAPTPGIVDTIRTADLVIIAPSNPVVSIDPILAIGAIRNEVAAHQNVVAVSPIVGGQALKGPAGRLLSELGSESSAVGVARWYQEIISTLVIDTADAESAGPIAEVGVKPVVTDTLMVDLEASAALAEVILRFT